MTEQEDVVAMKIVATQVAVEALEEAVGMPL